MKKKYSKFFPLGMTTIKKGDSIENGPAFPET